MNTILKIIFILALSYQSKTQNCLTVKESTLNSFGYFITQDLPVEFCIDNDFVWIGNKKYTVTERGDSYALTKYFKYIFDRNCIEVYDLKGRLQKVYRISNN